MSERMKNCDEIVEQLSAFIDGELSADDREKVRIHLDQCADCRDLLAALRETAESVSELPPVRAPKELRDRVMARVAEESDRRRISRTRLFWPVAAAILIASVIYLMDQSPHTKRAGNNFGQLALKSEADLPQGPAAETYFKAAPEAKSLTIADSPVPAAAPSAPALKDESIGQEQRLAFTRELPSPAADSQSALPSSSFAARSAGSFDGVETMAERGGLPAETNEEMPRVVDVVFLTNNVELAYQRVNQLAAANRWPSPALGLSQMQDATEARIKALQKADINTKKITLLLNNMEILDISNLLANEGLLGPAAAMPTGLRHFSQNAGVIMSNVEVLNDGAELQSLLRQEMNQSQRQIEQLQSGLPTNIYFRPIAVENEAATGVVSEPAPAKE